MKDQRAMRYQPFRRRHRHGFSLLEVLVSIAILLTGIVLILGFLPVTLRQNQRSSDVSVAAYLAQLKAEEIRRDDSNSHQLIGEIRSLTTPTTAVIFPFDNRFAYQYSGVSLLDPASAPGVARVIISFAKTSRPHGRHPV